MRISDWSSDVCSSDLERPWTVITIRNVPGYMPVRYDQFPSREDALTYFQEVVVETTRVSLGNSDPSPVPSIEQYTSWLKLEKLYDPLLNPGRSDAPKSELQSLMPISYAVF